MPQAAVKTGSGPTAMVAIEQHFPKDQRIIDDDLAYRILPRGMRAYVWLMRLDQARDWMVRASEKSLPGIRAGMRCRKRYIDEKLVDSAEQIDAVVNLGAGLDTRVYRLPDLSNKPVWEVDQPENVEPKRARLRKLLGAVPPRVALVPIDFDCEELDTVLAAHGYPAKERTFFVWEAVTQYLTGAGIGADFDYLATAAWQPSGFHLRAQGLPGRPGHGWRGGPLRAVHRA